MTRTENLRTAYVGSKVHAADADSPTNRSALRAGGTHGVTLCGRYALVGDIPFANMGIVVCRMCARKAEHG
jgi:hypothetical protein